MINAPSGSIIVQKWREGKDANYGYNAATEVYEDMVKAGRSAPHPIQAVHRVGAKARRRNQA